MRSEKSGRADMRLVLLYSEIGIAPLCAFRYAIGKSGSMEAVSRESVLGTLSLLLWVMLSYVSIKGVGILPRIDNKGAGGHFSLYTLVRAHRRRMFIPAALGGAALLTNAVIVPVMSFMAAVSGIQTVPSAASAQFGPNALPAVTMFILTVFFLFQWFDDRDNERFLATLMLVWLLLIGVTGAARLVSAPEAVKALNPLVGFRYLHSLGIRKAFQSFGILFLAAAGTELLYAGSDPADRKTLARLWPFALLCVCLNYLGQGAWLLRQTGEGGQLARSVTDPFFQMLPAPLRVQAVLLALAAVWAGAQTVTDRAFSLAAEAIGTDFLPPLEIRLSGPPSNKICLPAMNFQMWLLSCFFIWLFRSPERLAPVYAGTAAAAMLASTLMLDACWQRKRGKRPARLLLVCFGLTESIFLLSNAARLQTEGLAAAGLMILLFLALLAWNRGLAVEKKYSSRLPVRDYLSQLHELHDCEDCPVLADNLVYFEHEGDLESVDEAVLYSLLERDYKRACSYWFVSIHPAEEPDTLNYRLENFGSDFVFRLKLELGYRCCQPVTKYLRDVWDELDKQGLLESRRIRPRLKTESGLGSFCCCLIRREAESLESMSAGEIWALRIRSLLQDLAGAREESFAQAGMDVLTERIPLTLMERRRRSIRMERVDWNTRREE